MFTRRGRKTCVPYSPHSRVALLTFCLSFRKSEACLHLLRLRRAMHARISTSFRAIALCIQLSVIAAWSVDLIGAVYLFDLWFFVCDSPNYAANWEKLLRIVQGLYARPLIVLLHASIHTRVYSWYSHYFIFRVVYLYDLQRMIFALLDDNFYLCLEEGLVRRIWKVQWKCLFLWKVAVCIECRFMSSYTWPSSQVLKSPTPNTRIRRVLHREPFNARELTL